MEQQTPDLQYLAQYALGALRRRWWLIALPLLVGGALSAGVAYVLPATYQATARILVESQQIPDELAQSTVAADAAERIRLINQRLTTRANMLDIASRFSVFANQPGLSPTDIVTRMRAATQIQPNSATNRRRDATVTTVDISFSADNPRVAAQVANELLTQVLAQNVAQRSARASDTVAFFDREVERLLGEMGRRETEIAGFKSENQMSLPETVDFWRNELTNLQRENFLSESRRLSLEDVRTKLLDAIRLGRTVTGAVAASPEQIELQRLRSTLAQQSAVFADSHPTVRALRARISALEAQTTVGAAEPEAGADPDAPPPVTEAEREIERLDAELALLEQQREAMRERQATIEAAIGKSPQVAIALNAMTRELEALQAQYQRAVAKRAEAVTGERLEVSQQAERFEVIEQPQAPERPISPNRPVIAAAGAAASLMVGLGLAALAELINPALRVPRDFEFRLGMRPLATVPYIATAREERRRRWTIRAAALFVVAVLPAGLWLVDTQVTPLQLLVERAMERTGAERLLTLIENRLRG